MPAEAPTSSISSRGGATSDTSIFFPQSHTPEGLEHWPFPPFLAAAPRPIQHLRRIYRRRGICPASVSPQTGLLLHAITRLVAPRTAVEIGSFRGVSAVWIAAAMSENATLHCIDPFGPIKRGPPPDEIRRWLRHTRVRLDLRTAGLSRCARVHRGDSASVLDRLRTGERLPPVDMAFVDGDHTFEGVLRDIRALDPSLHDHSCIILHDVFPERSGCDGPRQFLDRRAEFLPRGFAACDLYTAPANFGISILHPARSVNLLAPTIDPDAERLFLFALLINARPRVVEIRGVPDPADTEVVTSAAAAIHACNPQDRTLIAPTSADQPLPRPRHIGWLRTADLAPVPVAAEHPRARDIIIARAPCHDAPDRLLECLTPGGLLILPGQSRFSGAPPAQCCRLGNFLIARRPLEN